MSNRVASLAKTYHVMYRHTKNHDCQDENIDLLETHVLALEIEIFGPADWLGMLKLGGGAEVLLRLGSLGISIFFNAN